MFPHAAMAASLTSGTSQRANGTANLCREAGAAAAVRASPLLRSLSESGDELYVLTTHYIFEMLLGNPLNFQKKIKNLNPSRAVHHITKHPVHMN